LPQGTLACVVGEGSKSTLLRLIGEVMVPSKGKLFVPSHLRVLHVDKAVQMFDESIAYNLFFGCLGSSGAVTPAELDKQVLHRGWRICERLNFSPEMLHYAKIVGSGSSEELEESKELLQCLTQSQRKKIHIARALIYNPEILVMHTPSMYLPLDAKTKMFESLREFVDNRGVQMDPASVKERRPRICIFSSVDPEKPILRQGIGD